ncbi:MAG TPA: hypothetical protein VF819_01120 [Nitrospira sp.]
MSSLDYTTEDLARRNGAGLLAMQLQTLQREHNESVHRHDERIRNIRAELTRAERIGLAVLRAEADGRKTVRIDKLTEAA